LKRLLPWPAGFAWAAVAMFFLGGVVDVDDAGGFLWAWRVDRQSALGEPISSMGQFGHGKAHIS
jgi:hypothetical protein